MKKSFNTVLDNANTSGLLKSLLDNNSTLGSICIGLGYSSHGRNTAALSIYLASNKIEFKNHSLKTKTFETRSCVNCGDTFQVSVHNKKASKVLTCSYACSGAYPGFIQNRLSAKLDIEPTHYITIAKRAGLVSCCICNEKEVVDIHHLDEDSTNNNVDNLIPLCPTHHAYMHRGKSNLILDNIIAYLDSRII